MKRALIETWEFVRAYELVPLFVVIGLILWPYLNGG